MANIAIDEQVAKADIELFTLHADKIASGNTLAPSELKKMPGGQEIVRLASELYNKAMLPLIGLMLRDGKYLMELVEGFEETDEQASQ